MNADYLRSLLSYDPDTGVFIWISVRLGRCKKGNRAGGFSHGYRRIRLGDRRYAEHRLAWLYMTGSWPEGELDHRNGNKQDNSWCNLRVATRTENMANARARKLVKGVTRVRTGKWTAQIQKHGVKEHLGTFDTADAAHAAYKNRAAELFGEFARFE